MMIVICSAMGSSANRPILEFSTADSRRMFTIIPYGQGKLPAACGEAPDLLASVVPDGQLCDPAQRPFVQLSYQEIPADEIDAVLGYAGIAAANAPVGLPGEFEPRKQ